MARDYRDLRVFGLADELVIEVYRISRGFPKEEVFGLTSQMRRAAVSVVANIVEGSHRRSEAEFLNFLNIALGSAGELGYYITLAHRLGYMDGSAADALSESQDHCVKALQSLMSSIRPRQSKAASSA